MRLVLGQHMSHPDNSVAGVVAGGYRLTSQLPIFRPAVGGSRELPLRRLRLQAGRGGAGRARGIRVAEELR